jgi:hypothetical protein
MIFCTIVFIDISIKEKSKGINPMKRIGTLTKVFILFVLVLLICNVDDFLSLHDIKNDYVI